jgi:hypothetical protein
MNETQRYQNEKRLDRERSAFGPGVMYDSEIGAVCIAGYGQEINLPPYEALGLLAWLRSQEAFLQDRANNYYDCKECGETHHKSVKVCCVNEGE